MTDALRTAAQDAANFLEELPADLGRGSWNGMRVQIAYALRAALAAPPAAQPSVELTDAMVEAALDASYGDVNWRSSVYADLDKADMRAALVAAMNAKGAT